MKKLVFLALIVMVGGFLLLPVGSLDSSVVYPKAAHGKQPEFFAKLTSATPFDFPQQWRKTKKDSDELIRSKEGFSSRMQVTDYKWARAYGLEGVDFFYTMHPSKEGGCVICSWNWPTESSTTSFFKVSSKGTFDWMKRTKAGSGFSIFCIEPTDDGGYIGAAQASGAGAEGVAIKFSSNWDIEWMTIFGGLYFESAKSIIQTSDKGFLVLCLSSTFLGSYPDQEIGDLWLVKLSPDGVLEKQCSIGGPKEETAIWGLSRRPSVVETKYGYLIACDTNSFGRSDIWLIMVNHQMDNVSWQKLYGGAEDEHLFSNGPYLQLTSDSEGCLVAGFTMSFGVVNSQTNTRFSDAWVFRVNLANGAIDWQKAIGGENSDSAACIQTTLDGNYAIVGHSNSFNATDDLDIWFLIIDENGAILQEKTYGTGMLDTGMIVKQNNDGDFFIGGITTGASESEDIIVLKVSSDGSLYSGGGFVKDSNAIITETSAVPADTHELLWPTDAHSGRINLSFDPDNLVSTEVLCWNLNQAPVNVHFERTENKSFFVSEAWNTITWSPNPYNSQFSIAEYRIYRKDMDYETYPYQLIATLPANVNIFVDSKEATGMNENARYLYKVTSVDAEGNESPKSELVGNVN